MLTICMFGSQNTYQAILKSNKTVFNLSSLMQLTGNYDKKSLVKSLYYYRRKGFLISLRSGLYAKPDYNPLELACSVFSNSYISLQTVLLKAGVIFQFSDKITCISGLSRELVIDGRIFLYRRIKPELWGGMRGIRQECGYYIATPERAVLDMFYLYPDIGYFDNPSKLDFALMEDIMCDYKNVQFERRVSKWIKTNICSI